MSWYDSITSLFTSEDSVSIDQTAPQIPSFTPIASASTLLSPNYSISALSQTSKPLMTPNLPTTEDQLYNMSVLAKTLESLRSIIGPFSIISGFRTKELQQLLASSGEPVAAGVSYHELGLAVDIYPTNMSIDEFFGRLLSDEPLKAQFAEIAIKPKQNSIHLSVNTPDNMKEPKILGLNNDNVYGRLSLDDIANYIAPYMASIDEAYDYAASKLVTYNKTPLILTVAVSLAGMAYLFLNKPKKTV